MELIIGIIAVVAVVAAFSSGCSTSSKPNNHSKDVSNGTKKVPKTVCGYCGGEGRIRKEEKIRVPGTNGYDTRTWYEECPSCYGKGFHS